MTWVRTFCEGLNPVSVQIPPGPFHVTNHRFPIGCLDSLKTLSASHRARTRFFSTHYLLVN